jgi:nucleotide-binding universal stress UspA family protein
MRRAYSGAPLAADVYHVALAVTPDDDHLGDKVEAVADLPDATEAVRVTLVHVHRGDASVESIPAVAEARERLEAADVETEVRGEVDQDPTRGLLDAAADLDVDAICVGGRRRSPAGKLQLKPGATEVLLRAEVPVVVAGDLASRDRRV